MTASAAVSSTAERTSFWKPGCSTMILYRPGGEGVGNVLAVCVRDGLALDAGGFVLNEDFGVCDGGTGLVGDVAGDGAVRALGEERETEGEEVEERARHSGG